MFPSTVELDIIPLNSAELQFISGMVLLSVIERSPKTESVYEHVRGTTMSLTEVSRKIEKC